MKKILSILLCALLVCCTLSVAVQAVETELPLIIITGYGTPSLYQNYGEKNQSKAWSFSPLEAVRATLEDLENALPATVEFIKGSGTYLGKCVARGGNDILDYMFCNPDGSSITELSHYPNDPELSNYKYLLENGLDEDIYEAWFCEPLVQSDIAAENIFIFQYDFRMSAYDISEELNAYVDDVLEYTGARKLNAFGLSYGGFILGTFLSRFGTDGRIDNAVLNVPALGGTSFARNFLMGEAELPIGQLLRYAFSAIDLEVDVEQLVENLDGKRLNETVVAFLQDMQGMPLYWGSMWDLLSIEDYNELKVQLLDSTESAAIIEKSDYIHNEIMPNYNKNFTACMNKGVKISIMTNTGFETAFGSDDVADMLIDCRLGSGSTCSKLGERFSDGYTGCYTVCRNRQHSHVSPSMQVDASSAYLPENTWFMDDQGHATYFTEDYTESLITKLLFTDKPIDIYSDPAYPQFQTSSLSYYGVYAKFNSSSSGFVSSDDTALVIKNVSQYYPISLTSVVCEGMDISFDLTDIGYIAPGETVEIPFEGEIPELSATYSKIRIDFVRLGSLTPCNTRDFDFTIQNGEAPIYDGGFTELSSQTTSDIMTKITNVVKAFFSFFTSFITRLFNR